MFLIHIIRDSHLVMTSPLWGMIIFVWNANKNRTTIRFSSTWKFAFSVNVVVIFSTVWVWFSYVKMWVYLTWVLTTLVIYWITSIIASLLHGLWIPLTLPVVSVHLCHENHKGDASIYNVLKSFSSFRDCPKNNGDFISMLQEGATCLQ